MYLSCMGILRIFQKCYFREGNLRGIPIDSRPREDLFKRLRTSHNRCAKTWKPNSQQIPVISLVLDRVIPQHVACAVWTSITPSATISLPRVSSFAWAFLTSTVTFIIGFFVGLATSHVCPWAGRQGSYWLVGCWVSHYRPIGCPQMTWGRTLENALKSKGISKDFDEWIAIAKDRSKWKQLTHSIPTFPNLLMPDGWRTPREKMITIALRKRTLSPFRLVLKVTFFCCYLPQLFFFRID